MFIKKNNIENGNVKIVNIPTSSFKEIYVEEDNLIIETNENNKKFAFEFNSSEEANKALKNVFTTLGLKSPYNNVIDLSVLEVEENTNIIKYITFDEIAEKFKVDPRSLFISKSMILNGEIDESSENE